MWKTVLLVAAASLAITGRATSQDTTPEGAWCGREDIGGGVIAERCHFMTYQECREIMLGGSATSCTQNPRYVAPAITSPASPPVQAQPRRPAR